MTSSDDGLTHSTRLDTFEQLAARLEDFIDRWEHEPAPPDIDDHLGVPADLRRPLLVELIKVDLEFRWDSDGETRRLLDYLDQYPELELDGVPSDLLYEEFHIRRRSGDRVQVAEYIERFPEQETEIRRLLRVDEDFQTTALVTRRARQVLDELHVGEAIGDFELLRVLGAGTFGKVFLAHQKSMQRMVALKVSLNTGREHQTLAQFDHEHIVRVYDQRVEEDRQIRLLYMQYHPGGTLQEVVQRVRDLEEQKRHGGIVETLIREALESRGEDSERLLIDGRGAAEISWPEFVCWLGARLATGLEHAHQRGTLHRDVKPANVLLSRTGTPKLADFNISFCENLADAAPAAYFGGSLAYMSPEQLEACHPVMDCSPESLDARSDLFSLGVVLWELLTGLRPYVDEPPSGSWPVTIENMLKLRRYGLTEEALAALPANCPPSIVRVLTRCLDPEPARRWQDCGELARQLDACRNNELQELLSPESRPVTRFASKHFVLLAFVATAVPNVFAGAFNLAYNYQEIVSRLGPTEQESFFRIQSIINSVAYPVGLGAVTLLAWSIVRGMRLIESDAFVSDERRRLIRRRCLDMGHYAARTSLSLWILAGFVYPITMHVAADGQMPMEMYAHFWGSLVLCGLIAAGYPFFGVTWLSVRGMYPLLVRDNLDFEEDRHPLDRLTRRCWAYLITAVLVPFLAVLVLMLVQLPSRFALIMLSGGSLVGFVLVLMAFRSLQSSLQVLLK